MEKNGMWKGHYGREPFDLRLTVLRMLYKLPLLLGITLLGSLVLGGAYYMKNVLFRGESRYEAVSYYRIEYAVEEEKDVGTVYINQVSWNTYLRSELFLDKVLKNMADMSYSSTLGNIDATELAESIQIKMESDLRLLTMVVTTDDPEKSVLISGAVGAAFAGGFAEEIREVEEIITIDSGDSASEVLPDVRVGRAFALSAVLSCFFAVMLFLLKETGDDSIWLPSSLWRRYGLRTVGTLESRELKENVRYFFPESMGRVAVCGCQEGTDCSEALERLRRECPETVGEGWFAVTEDPFGEGVCSRLRETGGILLVVRAGSHAGRRLEHVLEYLQQQDCQVTAALLWGADERLIRRYYRTIMRRDSL